MSGADLPSDGLYSDSFPTPKIHTFARIVGGGTPSSSLQNWNGEVPFATPVDLRGLEGALLESTERTLTDKGAEVGSRIVSTGVLFSCRAPIGQVGITRRETAFNQGCKAIVGEFCDRYVAYALVAARPLLEARGDGTTFKEISSSSLGNFKVPLPPLDVQRAIAEYLDRETAEIDAMVTNLDELVTAMKERRAAAITDAVTGRSEGDKMTAHPYLGDFCADWGLSRLSLLGDRVRYLNAGMVENNLLSLSYGEVIRRDIDNSEGLRPASYETYQIIENGDLVFRFTDLQNDQKSLRSALSKERGIVSSAYICFRPDKSKCNAEYLSYLMRAVDTHKTFYEMGSGVRQTLNYEEFSTLRLPLPPLDEQRRIADHLDEVTSEIDRMVADATELKALLIERRSALITEVVTGRKDITNQ